jgi:hypothetical protein
MRNNRARLLWDGKASETSSSKPSPRSTAPLPAHIRTGMRESKLLGLPGLITFDIEALFRTPFAGILNFVAVLVFIIVFAWMTRPLRKQRRVAHFDCNPFNFFVQHSVHGFLLFRLNGCSSSMVAARRVPPLSHNALNCPSNASGSDGASAGDCFLAALREMEIALPGFHTRTLIPLLALHHESHDRAYLRVCERLIADVLFLKEMTERFTALERPLRGHS